MLKAVADKQSPTPALPPGSRPGSAGDGGVSAPSFSVRDATSRFEPRPGGAPAAPPPPWVDDVTTPHFNRAPDATKLFCNIHDKVQVARNHFREKLLVWVLESGLKEEEYSLIGDPLDSRFEIQLAGDNRIASVRAKQFHTSLQLGRGKWKTQEVEDSLGTNHKFYINPDKNPAQMRREVLAKRLQGIISTHCIDKAYFVKNLQVHYFVTAGLLFLWYSLGRKVPVCTGATPRGLSSSLIRQLLKKPLDSMSSVGGSLPNANFPCHWLVLSCRYSPGMVRVFVCSTGLTGSKWAQYSRYFFRDRHILCLQEFMAIETIFY